jgi:hypothetical protein
MEPLERCCQVALAWAMGQEVVVGILVVEQGMLEVGARRLSPRQEQFGK